MRSPQLGLLPEHTFTRAQEQGWWGGVLCLLLSPSSLFSRVMPRTPDNWKKSDSWMPSLRRKRVESSNPWATWPMCGTSADDA